MVRVPLILLARRRNSFPVSGVGALRKGRGRLHLGVWVSSVIAVPFYVLPSGQPQPSDWFMLAAALMSFGIRVPKQTLRLIYRWTIPAIGFPLYALLITSFWVWRLGDERMLLAPAYYAFNALVFLAFLRAAAVFRARFLQLIVCGYIVSLLIQLALLATGYSAGVRATASFNNPNQLGYFSLLVATMIALAAGGGPARLLPKWVAVIGLLAALWVAAVSLSKAAVVGVALLCAMLVRARPALAAGVLLAGLGLSYVVNLDPVVTALHQRIQMIGKDSDDSLEARGYSLIWEHPEHLLLGAGEGANYRFGRGIEIHSTFGTLLFCYGIPGLSLFCWLLYKIYRKSGVQTFQFLVPALVYGLTHHGLRFTELWILLALLPSLAGCGYKVPKLIRRGTVAGQSTAARQGRLVWGDLSPRRGLR